MPARVSLSDCLFRNNSAARSGGALALTSDVMADASRAPLMLATDTTFKFNRAGMHGGALFSDAWRLVLHDSQLQGNTVPQQDSAQELMGGYCVQSCLVIMHQSNAKGIIQGVGHLQTVV